MAQLLHENNLKGDALEYIIYGLANMLSLNALSMQECLKHTKAFLQIQSLGIWKSALTARVRHIFIFYIYANVITIFLLYTYI